ncbi:hypothetical protein NDU88_002516 [Pleurodeles waltl]|uniref:Uncharacterized protein n=1 Tax=Pleurodeles waltl TaxID=8319 RepID=A0AAV7VES3_PLEWA|nr:hypothetical protein NDU88_002516 [Pleurodeles waltl]
MVKRSEGSPRLPLSIRFDLGQILPRTGRVEREPHEEAATAMASGHAPRQENTLAGFSWVADSHRVKALIPKEKYFLDALSVSLSASYNGRLSPLLTRACARTQPACQPFPDSRLHTDIPQIPLLAS